MMRRTFFALLFAIPSFLLCQNPPSEPSPRLTIQDSFLFASDSRSGAPAGWRLSPGSNAHVDNQVAHSGHASVRLDRDSSSTGNFSVIARSLPVDFTGGTVEFRGFLRTKNVNGFAGLYILESGESGVLQIKRMDDQHIDGTRDWTEFSVSIPIVAEARQLYFGVRLDGTGAMWVDDLRLLVDGKPIAEAKSAERVLTVLDSDHEFDKGSQIKLDSLSPIQVENLFTLGRVWGFLKYHHPVVTEGQRQWDYDLFRILPAVLAAPDGAHANDALVQWIDSLGKISDCQADQCVPSPGGDLNLKPDIDWIHDTTTLGYALSLRLQRIYRDRPRNGQFYVSLATAAGNPRFDHELPYPAVTFPDPGFQLLALFRWWNIMQYWAPYRVDAGQNWPNVLADFIPKLALAKNRTAYQLALFELIAKANDTHANLWSSLDARPPVGKCFVPVDLQFIDGHAVVTGFADKQASTQSALHIGDVIEAIDTTTVAKLTEEWTPYYADSNVAARRRDMARTLTRGDCKSAAFGITRNSKQLTLSLDRVPFKPAAYFKWHYVAGDTFRLLSPDVAYLKLTEIKPTEIETDMDRAQGTKGLIIDLRNYPEFVPFIVGSFLAANPTPFATFTHPDIANPGTFRFGPPATIEPGKTHYAGRVVILVDEVTQSRAEFTAMALRSAPRSIIIGSTTAGADGDVSEIRLPGDLWTMISGIGVFYPDHAPTQRIGIVPDVQARPTLAGIKAGRDEVLETAIRKIVGPDLPEATVEKLAKPPAEPQPAPTM